MTSLTVSIDDKAVLTVRTEGKTLDFIVGDAFKNKAIPAGPIDLSTLKISVSSE